MNSNNYLDEVYTVRESNYGDQGDSSGDDSDWDQRRGWQDFYDAISDSASLRNALDPISEQDKFDKSVNLNQTPIPPLFTEREKFTSTGTIPYNGQAQQANQASSVQSRQMRQHAPTSPVDEFLAICTAFLAKLPAISLDEIKIKGS